MNRRLFEWHVRFGWWSFLVFATLGLALETFHGLKIALYMDGANATRRLMWTLAHAHGTLLSLVHVLFGLSAGVLIHLEAQRLRFMGRCLTGATLLLPGGFFLAGVVVYSGDPGLSILIVPAGAVLLMTAVFLIARGTAFSDAATPVESQETRAADQRAGRRTASKRG